MTWGVRSLTVRHRDGIALHDVDLDLVPGRLVAVVGGDGAGKTTLCRVLSRLRSPDAGTVTLPQARRVAYQSASSGAWPDLTVDENLSFVARAHRMSPTALTGRRSVLLAATGLESAVDRLAGRLSGGMRQKLGVAMALLPAPDLLVLDEPTTGVDPVSRSDLWRVIAGAAASGAAVVMTTTYLTEAERASEILALEAGSVLARGDRAAVAAAIPGTIWECSHRPDSPARWRRGRRWRQWTAGVDAPPGARRIEPDLTDLLTAASLRHEGAGA